MRECELVGLVGEAYGRVAAAERDLAVVEGSSDTEALRAALAEFVGVWCALGLEERARLLALVLGEVIADDRTGEAQPRFRGART